MKLVGIERRSSVNAYLTVDCNAEEELELIKKIYGEKIIKAIEPPKNVAGEFVVIDTDFHIVKPDVVSNPPSESSTQPSVFVNSGPVRGRGNSPWNWKAILDYVAETLKTKKHIGIQEVREMLQEQGIRPPDYQTMLVHMKSDSRFYNPLHGVWKLRKTGVVEQDARSFQEKQEDDRQALASYGKDIPRERGEKPYKETGKKSPYLTQY